MTIWRYDNVRAMLAIPDRAIRNSVRTSLQNRGLRNLIEAQDITDIHAGIQGGDLDLLLTAPDIPGGDVSRMLQEMRHSRIGDNPFSIVMTLLECPSQDLVRRVVDSGTDDLLLMPMLPIQMVGRLDNFVSGRKQFVITHDYIGPDRRTSDRPGTMPAPRVDVPNPIRWQVVSNSDRASLKSMVRDASLRINMHKMRRYCLQISYLSERIIAGFFDGTDLALLQADAAALSTVAEDLGRRMQDTIYMHGIDLILSLNALALKLTIKDRPPRQVEVEILPTLARAIQRMFDDADQSPIQLLAAQGAA